MSSARPTAEPLGPAPDGEAEIGERITLLDLSTNAVLDYRLVEPAGEESDEEISVRTPLGAALLGCHVGDVIALEDGGQIMQLEVVEIDG